MVMVVSVEVVLMGGPETGGGVILMLYTTFSPFGGGVHSMVTAELVLPGIRLLSLTSVGGPVAIIVNKNVGQLLTTPFKCTRNSRPNALRTRLHNGVESCAQILPRNFQTTKCLGRLEILTGELDWSTRQEH